MGYYTITLCPVFPIHSSREARSRFFLIMPKQQELPIIQRTYDLIQWYVPLLNKLPRNYKFFPRYTVALSSAIVLEVYPSRAGCASVPE